MMSLLKNLVVGALSKTKKMVTYAAHNQYS